MGRDGSRFIRLVGAPETDAMAGLPDPRTTRWTPQRKAEVVDAVHRGRLTLAEACARYELSTEEYLTWEEGLSRYGLSGLRVHHRTVPAQRFSERSKPQPVLHARH